MKDRIKSWFGSIPFAVTVISFLILWVIPTSMSQPNTLLNLFALALIASVCYWIFNIESLVNHRKVFLARRAALRPTKTAK